MRANSLQLNAYLQHILLALSCAIVFGGCSGGTNSNPTSSQSKQLTLQQYIALLDYQPLATNMPRALKGITPTKIGNQQIFTLVAPVSLGTIQMNYYSDAECNNLVYTTLLHDTNLKQK